LIRRLQGAGPVLERRSLRRWLFTAMAIAGALPLVVLPPLLITPSGAENVDGTRILAISVCSLLGTVWALVFASLAFRAEDEFTQQGSKFAWYWGAMGGVVVSAPIYVFIQTGGLHWLDPAVPFSKALGRAFAMGYGLLLFSQLAGYVAVLSWWKATRR